MEQQLLAFLEFLQQEYKYSDNTTAAYRNDLFQFLSFFGGGQFANISSCTDVN